MLLLKLNKEVVHGIINFTLHLTTFIMAEKQNFTTLLSKVILPKVEVIAIIISSIGFLLYLLKQTGAQQLLMIGLSTLASVFFLTANTLPPAIEKTLTETTKRSFFDTLLNFIWKIRLVADQLLQPSILKCV